MCTRSWIQDEEILDDVVVAAKLEGVFSALTLEDASVKDNDICKK
ncbi:hypothetical protein LINGRAHAP2_LOCUS14763 [Linum grandiflorum]